MAKRSDDDDRLVCGVQVEAWDALDLTPPYRPEYNWPRLQRTLKDALEPLTPHKDLWDRITKWEADARELGVERRPALWAEKIVALDEFVQAGRVAWPGASYRGREGERRAAGPWEVADLREALVARLKGAERLAFHAAGAPVVQNTPEVPQPSTDVEPSTTAGEPPTNAAAETAPPTHRLRKRYKGALAFLEMLKKRRGKPVQGSEVGDLRRALEDAGVGNPEAVVKNVKDLLRGQWGIEPKGLGAEGLCEVVWKHRSRLIKEAKEVM